MLLKGLSEEIQYIFVGYTVSKILGKTGQLLTLIIDGTEASLYTKKYIQLSTSTYTDQILIKIIKIFYKLYITEVNFC